MMKTRLTTSAELQIILTELNRRTNITPNILCRYGISLSLNDNSELELDYDSKGQEFHRPVLTGDNDILFRELIRQKENRYISDDEYFTTYLKAHIERGVRLLNNEIQLCGSWENFIVEHFNPERGAMI